MAITAQPPPGPSPSPMSGRRNWCLGDFAGTCEEDLPWGLWDMLERNGKGTS